jgi:hypothetical protein
LMNLATRSMRNRTELIFQVVRERRMGTTIPAMAQSASDEATRQSMMFWIARRGRLTQFTALPRAEVSRGI